MGIRHSVAAGAGSGAGGLVNGTDWNAEHVSEWTQIATSGTLSGTSYTFSSIPQTYADLLLVLEGVSHNNASNTPVSLALGDGTWTTTNVALTATHASTGVVNGAVFIPGYTKTRGIALLGTLVATSGTAQLAANSSTGIGPSLVWRIPAGIALVRIGPNAGSLDAGIATLYGR